MLNGRGGVLLDGLLTIVRIRRFRGDRLVFFCVILVARVRNLGERFAWVFEVLYQIWKNGDSISVSD